MRGKVMTFEKCSVCQKPFKNKKDVAIYCPKCQTVPKSFFVFLYHEGQRYRIFRDRDGNILDSYRRASNLLEKMRSDMNERKFDIRNYLPAEIAEFKGEKMLKKWQEIKESEKLSGWQKFKIKEYVNNHYLPYFKNKDMRDIKAGDVEDFCLALRKIKSKRTNTFLSEKTIKNIVDMFKTFCKWLYKREVISRVPIFPVISPPDKPIKWISKGNQLLLLNYIPDAHKPIFHFLMYHPCRPSEACALQVKHFDLEVRYISICQAFGFRGELKTRKNKKPYYLPLSKHFDTPLLKGKLPEAFVFTHQGKVYNVNYLGEIWREAFESAIKDGVKMAYINFYNATRHSIASQAINAGKSLESVSKALGHEQLETTRKKYAAMSVELIRDIVDDEVGSLGAKVVQLGEKRCKNSL